MLDPYQILGVSPLASSGEIRAAYCRLVKQLHPDLGPQDAETRDLLYRVNAAYSQLRGELDEASFQKEQEFYRGIAQRRRTRRRSVALACVLAPLVLVLPIENIQFSDAEPPKKFNELRDFKVATIAHKQWVNATASGYRLLKSVDQTQRPVSATAGSSVLPQSRGVPAVKSPSPNFYVLAAVTPDSRPAVSVAPAVEHLSSVPPTSVVLAEPHALIKSRHSSAAEVDQGVTPPNAPIGEVAAIATVPFPGKKILSEAASDRHRWHQYRDGRFGISLRYPRDLLANTQLSQNATDRLFLSRDGHTLLRITTEVRTKSTGVETELRKRIGSRYRGIPVEIEIHDNWFVVHGTMSGERFVERLDISCGGRLAHRTLLIYPDRHEDALSRMARELETSSIVKDRQRRCRDVFVSHHISER